MSQFEYIFKGATHTDTTRQYMNNIGMTTESIESVLAQKAFEENQNKKLRAEAYKRESDPLHIEWQFELTTANPDADSYKQRWIDKVLEIKTRYPLPE